ncbi:hypothetical protein ABT039_22695 [Streptomyces lasiicapitis]|uniref:hypothetical protein n=1 Tax=Streptomyces lasiicapitis TaxID=1923961 RepID=UPI0033181131
MEPNERESKLPWWYRTPPVAVSLTVTAATTIVIYTLISESLFTACAWGLGAGFLAGVVQGYAQSAHDQRRRSQPGEPG